MITRLETINTLRNLALFIDGEVEELDTLDRKEDQEQYDYRMNNIRRAVDSMYQVADELEKEDK